ncbi:DNA-3-methyladenine glycosylase [Mechercharimyces sp. CAU 1602]|uniref:DNA-3-methyladenine glycosylase family protein n=1 Tax=Mechercharimyces sp. CAU 1602 TaxID=2973933 RepID=UPI0021611A16|nr:DNA-3-methyladenine glycosylase [Mechercharimyces sp. CAU 1602]MCS1352038.1 DNA-3-methyladenine glycosylase [Mechercharimyces sp. CAU 1602]
MLTWEFKPQVPYSFAQTMRRLLSFSKSSYIQMDGFFYRTLRTTQGGIYVIGIAGSDEPEVVLRVQVFGKPSQEEENELKQLIAHMFSLNTDLTPFYKHAEQDEILTKVVAQRWGLHLIREPSLYECLMRTIIGQQLNLSFAATLIDRLIAFSSPSLSWNQQLLSVFPTAEMVAVLDYSDLEKLQFSKRKAEYVIDLSRSIAENNLDLAALSVLDNEEVSTTLLPYRGIGRWTVECFLLFGLGRPNLLPAVDIGLRNAIWKAYGYDEKPSEQEVRRLGQKWDPWGSYATFYLWDTLS